MEPTNIVTPNELLAAERDGQIASRLNTAADCVYKVRGECHVQPCRPRARGCIVRLRRAQCYNQTQFKSQA